MSASSESGQDCSKSKRRKIKSFDNATQTCLVKKRFKRISVIYSSSGWVSVFKVFVDQYVLIYFTSKSPLLWALIILHISFSILHAILPNILLLYSDHLKPFTNDNPPNANNFSSGQTSPIANRRLSKESIGKS